MKYDQLLKAESAKRVRRRPRHIEDNLQIACVKWFDLAYPALKRLLVHVPNGGYRNVLEAAKFKRMGVRAGFPDLLLLLPNKKYPCMGIEMKTAKGKQSENQKAYQSLFEHRGYRYVVTRSLDDFIHEITEYIKEV